MLPFDDEDLAAGPGRHLTHTQGRSKSGRRVKVKRELKREDSMDPAAQTQAFLTEEDWEQLLKNSKKRVFKTGDVIIAANSVSEALFRITTGTVAVTNDEKTLWTLTQGQLFGKPLPLISQTKWPTSSAWTQSSSTLHKPTSRSDSLRQIFWKSCGRSTRTWVFAFISISLSI